MIVATVSTQIRSADGAGWTSLNSTVQLNIRTSGLSTPFGYGNTTVKVNATYVGNASDDYQLGLQFSRGSSQSIQVDRVVFVNVEGGRNYTFANYDLNDTCSCFAGPTINLTLIGNTNLTADYTYATPKSVFSRSPTMTLLLPIFTITIATLVLRRQRKGSSP